MRVSEGISVITKRVLVLLFGAMMAVVLSVGLSAPASATGQQGNQGGQQGNQGGQQGNQGGQQGNQGGQQGNQGQGQERVQVTTPSGNTIKVAKPASENAAAFNGGQQGGGQQGGGNGGGGNDGGQQGGGNGGGQNAEGGIEGDVTGGDATGGSVEAEDSIVAFCQNVANQTIVNANTAAVSQEANAEQTNTITDTDGDADIDAGDVTATNMVELGGVSANVDQHCQATVNQAVAVIKH